jgi:hypothetical protein
MWADGQSVAATKRLMIAAIRTPPGARGVSGGQRASAVPVRWALSAPPPGGWALSAVRPLARWHRGFEGGGGASALTALLQHG